MNKFSNENNPPENVKQQVKAHIGESVVIVGDISGKEDIIIDGNIEGVINFREHDIVVGANGQIKSNMTAKSIVIAGDVKGELHASEQVTIKNSGKMLGDIHAPRVSLNDGCQFKGAVDMEKTGATAKRRTSKFRSPETPPSREHPIKIAKKLGRP